MKITEKQRGELWGETGPYSQVTLNTETRILDDRVSRTFLMIEVEINPFTYRMIKKHRAKFKDDNSIQHLLDQAEYRGFKFGYVVRTFSCEYRDESAMEEAQRALAHTKKTIFKMHRFVMDLL